jgi:hypothetical protein
MKSLTFFMNFIMLAIFVVLGGIALGYSPQARFFPLVAAIPAIGLLLLQIFLDVREAKKGVIAEPVAVDPGMPITIPLTQRQMVRREIIVWGYFLGLIGSVLLFGFWITIPVFLTLFLRHQAEMSWPRSLIMGLTTSVLFYLAFEKGLHAQLHPGFINEWVTDTFFPG